MFQRLTIRWPTVQAAHANKKDQRNMSAKFEKMAFEVDNGVAIMTINRPEARNALDNADAAIPLLPS